MKKKLSTRVVRRDRAREARGPTATTGVWSARETLEEISNTRDSDGEDQRVKTSEEMLETTGGAGNPNAAGVQARRSK
jgi:hypothetical protein